MALIPPYSLTATKFSSSRIDLAWSNGESYDLIDVQRKPAGGSWTIIDTISGSETTYQNTGLTNGTQYYYRVRGETGAEGSSAWSNEDDATTDLDAPSDLAANAVSGIRIDLSWVNNGTYNKIHIERKVAGGSYAEITYIYGTKTTYQDESVVDGTVYWYQIRARKLPGDVYSSYSTANDATTPLAAPTNLDGETISSTSIKIYWIDNSSNESGYRIYRDGVLVHTTAANVEEWTDSGLTAQTWYQYKVKAYNAETDSLYSNTLNIFTADPPSAPSDLTAQAVSTTQINLNWQDNSDNETGFKIEESSNGVDFSQIDTVGANVTHYERTGLSSNQKRWYKVRAYNVSGNSGYSNTADATTFAAIAAPSSLVATAFSDTEIEITFLDNSSEEDDHRVERKLGAGAYSEVKTLAANVTFWCDTGRTKGSSYTYKVRAKQGAAYSGYSNEFQVWTLGDLSAPTSLSISEKTDKTMRLTWTGVTQETGYKIEKSLNGSDFSEIAKIGADIEEFLVTDLDTSTQYWFKIRAYNIAGNSTYSSTVNDTTSASYSPTKFEKLIRKKNPNIIYIAEINPLIILSGFTLTSGRTYTYELEIEERGIDVDKVFENDAEYNERSSITEVEANASTFYFNYNTRMLYIHCSDGGSPSNFTILGDVWLYMTTYQDEAGTITFDDNHYLNLLSKENIPDIGHEISQLFEGTFSVSSGTIAFNNRKIGGEHYFDKLYERYIWRNRPITLKAGHEDFSYSEFKEVFTCLIDSVNCDNRLFTCDLIDAREGIHRTLPINKLWQTNFPLMSEDLEGVPIPISFGTKTGGLMFCIDSGNKKYLFHDGRVKSVSVVKQNDTTLVEDTDYYVDLQNGIITFDRDDLTIEDGDIFKINFVGIANSADESIDNGAEIFKYILNEYLGLTNSELDLDSIYETKYDKTQTLEAYIYQETESDEVIRNIEHSIEAYSRQDEKGRIGLKASQTTAPSDVKYVENHHIFNHSQNKNRGSLFKTVNVYYQEDPQTQKWSIVSKSDNKTDWKYRIKKGLDIYTYLSSSSNANTLANNILDLFDKDLITSTVAMILYGNLPGDLIKYTRNRFYSNAGTANELTLRILSIQKTLSTGTVEITAEKV